MKIAMIGQKGIPTQSGGIERHVEGLATSLVKEGFDVVVYCRRWYTGKHAKRYQGVQLKYLPSIPTKHLDAITHTFFSLLHAMWTGADVIHIHGIGPALLSWIPKYFSTATVIATFHCQDYQHQKWGIVARTMLKLGERAIVRFPHKTIVVSKTLQRYVRETYGRETDYIPNGVVFPRILKATSDERVLRRIDRGIVSGKYVLFVGRLVRHKGAHLLIESFRRLTTSHHLVIVGASAHTDEYEHLVRVLGATDKRIHIVGERTGQELAVLFRNARLLVQPSSSEGMSIVLLEAMSYGLPIVASDIKENAEVINDAGILFTQGNVASLTRKISIALKRPAVMRTLSLKGMERVQQHYQWSHVVSSTKACYLETLKRTGWVAKTLSQARS